MINSGKPPSPLPILTRRHSLDLGFLTWREKKCVCVLQQALIHPAAHSLSTQTDREEVAFGRSPRTPIQGKYGGMTRAMKEFTCLHPKGTGLFWGFAGSFVRVKSTHPSFVVAAAAAAAAAATSHCVQSARMLPDGWCLSTDPKTKLTSAHKKWRPFGVRWFDRITWRDWFVLRARLWYGQVCSLCALFTHCTGDNCAFLSRLRYFSVPSRCATLLWQPKYLFSM